MKKKLRKIIIDNDTFLWRREHHHAKTDDHSLCSEKVTVYLDTFKKSPLQLWFTEKKNANPGGKWCVGYPEAGVIWFFKPNATKEPPEDGHQRINLNRPKVIATFITHFIENGWSPRTSTKPLIIANGLELLEYLELPQGD